MDLLWLVFLGGLALLPPVTEIHKQLILLAFALFQLFEGSLLRRWERHGRTVAVAVKVALATLLINHTAQVPINSTYYPIFYIPVVTAAMLFGPWTTLAWTAVASAAYAAYLPLALRHYSIDAAGIDELILRVFFFFLLAVIINRFVIETRRQRDLYRHAAESLALANRDLVAAQQETRRAERLAALGQLSAGMAHEIRNPLAVIKGSAEMLQKSLGGGPSASPEVAAELAGYISSEVNRATLLVGRFLDFARPQPLERQPEALAPVLDRALAEARRLWPDSPAAIERDYVGANAWPPLAMDATLLERAFVNLAANALEAMASAAGAAPPRLRVHAAAALAGGQRGVLVTFADTGPGIPADLREQVFNPFFTTKPHGVGLGLAIVAKIVDQHDGQLRLEAAPGGGAQFEIFLPAA